MPEYKKPKSVPVPNMPDAGYPQTDIGMDGTWVKGKYPAGTKQKKYEDTRGMGAATKGGKFVNGFDV